MISLGTRTNTDSPIIAISGVQRGQSVNPLESSDIQRLGSWHRSSRRGAAFLILVVLILLVVVGTTRAFVRNEWTTQRGQAQRLRARSLAAAIEAYVQTSESSGELPSKSLLFPVTAVADQNKQSIEVSADQKRITARWLNGDQVIDEMHRPLTPLTDTLETSSENAE